MERSAVLSKLGFNSDRDFGQHHGSERPQVWPRHGVWRQGSRRSLERIRCLPLRESLLLCRSAGTGQWSMVVVAGSHGLLPTACVVSEGSGRDRLDLTLGPSSQESAVFSVDEARGSCQDSLERRSTRRHEHGRQRRLDFNMDSTEPVDGSPILENAAKPRCSVSRPHAPIAVNLAPMASGRIMRTDSVLMSRVLRFLSSVPGRQSDLPSLTPSLES